ncbi:hypothetical protein APSETT445_002431 [Aspergillus pseudonomiae]
MGNQSHPNLSITRSQHNTSHNALKSSTMQFTTLINVALLVTGSLGYANNCKGSSNSPSITDCQEAIRRIDEGKDYGDGSEFSVGNCYMVYATNGTGEHKLDGKTIRNTAQSILDSCGHHKGSYGTNNDCDSCHVTINYRAP